MGASINEAPDGKEHAVNDIDKAAVNIIRGILMVIWMIAICFVTGLGLLSTRRLGRTVLLGVAAVLAIFVLTEVTMWIASMLLAALVVSGLGAYDHHRVQTLVSRAQDVVSTCTHAPPEKCRVKSYGFPGRFAGFRFVVPATVTKSTRASIESDLKQLLPGTSKGSWKFEWDLRKGACRTIPVPKIPTKIAWDSNEKSDVVHNTRFERNGHSQTKPRLTKFCLGVGDAAQKIYWEMDNLYSSLLICGSPGSGKSSLLRAIIAWSIAEPRAFQIHIVDTKRIEFGWLEGYPKIAGVAETLNDAVEMFDGIADELDHRLAMMRKHKVQNLTELNRFLVATDKKPLPPVLVIIDELADLVEPSKGSKEEEATKSKCRSLIDRMVRLGRAPRIHFVIATQRPDASVLSGASKSNIPARIAIGTLSATGSEMVLENRLAAELPGIPGRAIFYRAGDCQELQTPYISVAQLQALVGRR